MNIFQDKKYTNQYDLLCHKIYRLVYSDETKVYGNRWKVQLLQLVRKYRDDLFSLNVKGKVYLLGKGVLESVLSDMSNNLDLWEGEAIMAWGRLNIYFMNKYDGTYWIESIPRHPSGSIPKQY